MSVALYEQIHKIEIFEVWIDGELSTRTTPFSLAELQELAKTKSLPKVVSYKRRVYPKDYLRKAEVDDCVTHHLLENRLVYRPYIPNNDPTQLAYFYLQAYAFSFELTGCPSLLDEWKEASENESSSASAVLPQYPVVFKVVPFESSELHSMSKLEKVAAFYVKCLNKWDKSFRAGGYKKRVYHDVVVPLDLFTSHYRRLKIKFGHWVEEWEESTDPQKFVFEDVAIAAFLIALWEIEGDFSVAPRIDSTANGDVESEVGNATGEEPSIAVTAPPGVRRPSFVDLGCGNGFLVYILTMEGFAGRGIDLVKRKIWSRYPSEVKLEESPIDPPNDVFEEDWILANHSDELTPWVPFIASRNNRKFFVLPCCEWNFDSKFSSRTKALSRYEMYLEYIKQLTVESGYKVEVEHLRIPSTRNISIIGRTRTIDPANPEDLERIRRQQAECLLKAKYTKFAPRTAPPKVHGVQKKRDRKPREKGTLHPSLVSEDVASSSAIIENQPVENGQTLVGAENGHMQTDANCDCNDEHCESNEMQS